MKRLGSIIAGVILGCLLAGAGSTELQITRVSGAAWTSPTSPNKTRDNAPAERVAQLRPSTTEPGPIFPNGLAKKPGENGTRRAADQEIPKAPYAYSPEEICLLLARTALDNSLPIDFFARLIWQESHFRAGAVSHAGAKGIAQFMPATAHERGLFDPFDPGQALPASGRFLRELKTQFGNLGLAAAAYNAGPARVSAWLHGRARLPQETQLYVRAVTGHPPKYWIGMKDRPEHRLGNTISCDKIARLLSRQRR